MRSVYVRDHCPSRRDRLGSKLADIPLAGACRRDSEVNQHKQDPEEKRRAKQPSFWGGNYGQRQVEDALAGVVGANDMAKESLVRQ